MTDVPADPFGERRRGSVRLVRYLLGARCEFVCDDRQLLGLVAAACDGLPAQRGPDASLRCRIDVRRAHGGVRAATPPAPLLHSGAAVLMAVVDARNHLVIVPAARAACVTLDDALLAHPYHARYELIEFALLGLIARVRSLVPLHAACVGDRRNGVLLLGESGAGKSTLCFHAAVGGLRLLGEDSVFVEPQTLRAYALPAFVHLHSDAVARLPRGLARQARRAPRIRRRGGAQKYEIDLRAMRHARLAGPLGLVAVVVLERRSRRGTPLRPLAARAVERLLLREQRYARGQAGWREFRKHLRGLPVFALSRVAPDVALAALRELLAGGGR